MLVRSRKLRYTNIQKFISPAQIALYSMFSADLIAMVSSNTHFEEKFSVSYSYVYAGEADTAFCMFT